MSAPLRTDDSRMDLRPPAPAEPYDPRPDGVWTPIRRIQSGIFAGRYMSFWLHVAQQPVHGRRKTEKDRRPLAPSPIVRLWMLDYGPEGTGQGRLIDPTDIEVGNLVCAAELCDPPGYPLRTAPRTPTAVPRDPSSSPVSRPLEPIYTSPTSTSTANDGRDDGDAPPGGSRRPPSPATRANESRRSSSARHPETPRHGATTRDREDQHRGVQQPMTSRSSSKGSERSRSVRGGSRGRSNRGDDKRVIVGRNLYGSLHVAGIRVAAMDGEAGLWFLFTDLSIRHEGSYSLKFRCYDMSAMDPESGPIPHLVETQSDDFRVYSPRNFPGLPKPTELAEHFALQGYKLNTRKNERQQPSPNPSPPP